MSCKFSPLPYKTRPALWLSGTKNLHFADAPFPIISAVDIDLKKFFDRNHHDRLITRMGQRITDKRIFRLVGLMFLNGYFLREEPCTDL